MKIQLNSFKQEKNLLLEEELSGEDLDIDIGVMHFPQPILVKAEAWKSAKDLTVNVHLEASRELTCSLCLEEFDNLFEKDFTLHYDIKGLDSVSIDQEVRDEIVTEHPIRILCRPDCRGLCPFCGANLNSEPCDCQTTNE